MKWVPFPWFPDYMISSLGDVKHTKNSRPLKPYVDNDGRLRVSLYRNGKQYTRMVHRVVARAFLEDYEDGLMVDFRNGDREDCRASNLVVTNRRVRRDGEE